MKTKHLLSGLLIVAVTGSCAERELEFTSIPVSEEANLWWARVPADINNDGLTDLVYQNNNGHGGWLGWIEAVDRHTWEPHVIARESPVGATFGSGDLDAGDIDGDGDVDVLGLEHPGEWDSAAAPTMIYWYNNPEWEPTLIGMVDACIKDISLADLNADGLPDISAITFETNTLTVIRQDAPGRWTQVVDTVLTNLHEGMDVGDIDGDGDLDVAANGYWVRNPGGNMSAGWDIYSIDDKWHNQDGDWSRNATKVCCHDMDGDGMCEVFISHSERDGYPVAMYHSKDPLSGNWDETILKEVLPACHTLQVFDFNLDGNPDVLAGVNKNRALALQAETFPVIIFLSDGKGNWTEFLLSEEGIYNGQGFDLEGDGDIDIFRLPTHDDNYFEIQANLIR